MADPVATDPSPADSLRTLAGDMRQHAVEARSRAASHREVADKAWSRAVQLDALAAEHEAAAERLSPAPAAAA